MSHTRRTLTLNDKWDIGLTKSGNIALTRNAAATAQNVANETRRFTNDTYFQQDKGVPHFLIELGRRVSNMSVLYSYLRRAALRVDDVNEIQTINVTGFDPATRVLSGEVTFTTKEGVRNVAITTYF